MKSTIMQAGNLGTEWTRERKYTWEEDEEQNEKTLEEKENETERKKK